MWKQLILIAGLRRSGTTWLGAMLGLADETEYIFEPDAPATHPESPYSQQVQALRDLPVWWVGSEHVAEYRDLEQALRAHTAWLAEQSFSIPVETLLIKIPQTEKLPLLLDAYQPAAVLYLRRNPLGVLNSYDEKGLHRTWMAREWDQFKVQAEDLFPQLTSAVSAASHFTEKIVLLVHARNLLADRALAGQRALFLEYEKLCVEPQLEFQRIFEWLGWRFNDDVWEQMLPMVDPQHPAGASGGLFETRKRSALRAYAWRRELAPHLLARAVRFIRRFDLPYPIPGRGLLPRRVSEWMWSVKMYRWRRAAYIREWGWSEARHWL